MELIEKAFYEDISGNTNDLDTLFTFSEWLQKNDDPRSRLLSLELALEFGLDIDDLATNFTGYSNYTSPIDLSCGKSIQSAYQELEILHEENKRRVLDLPEELSKEISLDWRYGFIHQISLESQQALDLLSEFIDPNQLRSITFLVLDNVTSLDLPDWVNELPYLVYLVVSCKNISQISKPFRNIEKLTDLDLSSNQLTEVPKWVRELHQLNELNLSCNKISSLPDDLQNLRCLTNFYLTNNNFTTIPGVLQKLTQLTSLHLGSNQITELPIWMNKLTQLEDLRLDHNNLSEIPTWIDSLEKLKLLNLNSNKLITIPNNIGNLSQLIYLDLSSNKLRELPDNIGNLSQLNNLDLSSNKLTKLPASFEQLQNLEYFSSRWKFLSNFPKTLTCLTVDMPPYWARLALTIFILGIIAFAILVYNL